MSGTSEDTNTSDFNWKLLLRRIKKGKTVLLIGPEVIVASPKKNISLKEALQAYIKEDLDGIVDSSALEKIQYYSEDGFFHLEDEYKSEVIDAVLQFYEEQELKEVYQKIVQIPFHLILSLSPDHLLCKAMEEENLDYQFHYYSKKFYNREKDNQILNFKPSLENRLVYNIFGSIEEEESLILSYDDLFEFLQRVFNNYDLPETVREGLQEANYFLFLGFNYSKWYLKLLLRLMNMHEKIRKVFGMDQPSRQELETFFVNEFDMKFTQKNTLSFIDELYQKCQEENILVQASLTPNKNTQTLSDEDIREVKVLIAKDKLKQAIQYLQDRLNNDSLNLIQANFEKIHKNNLEGLLYPREHDVALSKLRRALLDFVNDLNTPNS